VAGYGILVIIVEDGQLCHSNSLVYILKILGWTFRIGVYVGNLAALQQDPDLAGFS